MDPFSVNADLLVHASRPIKRASSWSRPFTKEPLGAYEVEYSRIERTPEGSRRREARPDVGVVQRILSRGRRRYTGGFSIQLLKFEWGGSFAYNVVSLFTAPHVLCLV